MDGEARDFQSTAVTAEGVPGVHEKVPIILRRAEFEKHDDVKNAGTP